MRPALKFNFVVVLTAFEQPGPGLPMWLKYNLSTFMTAVLYFAMSTFRQLNLC